MTFGGHTIRTASPSPRLVDLRAYADGVGHVMPAGRFETRHPCGEQVRAERFARPATAPCATCVGGRLSETEQRALWGDR